MKPRKIRRSYSRNRSSRFRRRSAAPRVIGTVFLVVLLIAAGVFSGWLIKNRLPAATPDDNTTPSTSASTSESPTVTTTTAVPQPEVSLPTLATLRAVVLPTTALSDLDSLSSTLDEAAAAGFNGIVFDLKDSTGVVYFAADSAYVAEAGSVADDALSKADLQAVLALCQQKNMLAVPRLYAFLDQTASANLVEARIQLTDQPTWQWLDNTREKGGKPWLNPYSPQAQEYLIGLATQLQDVGFSALIMDGVQFPSQLAYASFGTSSLTSLSKLEVLQSFVTSLTEAVPQCEVSVCATGLAVLSDSTEIYGGNPLRFGSDYLSPLVYPASLGTSLTHEETKITELTAHPAEAVAAACGLMNNRLELIDGETPTLLPWITTDSMTAAQIKAEIEAVTGGSATAPFVLTSSDLSYDFSALR